MASGANQELSGAAFRWVDTVADLRAVTGSTSQPVAVMGGYNSIGDGGGGVFYWDNSSSSGDNGGTIFVPTGSTTGRWQRLFSGAVNVRWFGATGLKTGDDTNAINAAVSYFETISGSPFRGGIYFPRGFYRINLPIVIGHSSIALVGESAYASFLYRIGTSDSTTIVFSSVGAQCCEVAHLHLGPPYPGPPQTSGSAILFNAPHVLGIRLHDLFIENVYTGVQCLGGALSYPSACVNEVSIRDVKIQAMNYGLILTNALNWSLTNIVVNMPAPEQCPPGSNIYGIWLDSGCEGFQWQSVYVLGGEHCWRMAHTQGGPRPPTEHSFHHCIGDNGSVSCFYISALHRSIFNTCLASAQSETSDACVVMDSTDVWGVVWDTSRVVNAIGHGMKVIAARNFSITNSTFSEWNLNGVGDHSAIIVYPNRSCSLTIIGNTFMRDSDFGTHLAWSTIRVLPGSYNKYVITNNISYGNDGLGSLASVSDSGNTSLKVVANNL